MRSDIGGAVYPAGHSAACELGRRTRGDRIGDAVRVLGTRTFHGCFGRFGREGLSRAIRRATTDYFFLAALPLVFLCLTRPQASFQSMIAYSETPVCLEISRTVLSPLASAAFTLALC